MRRFRDASRRAALVLFVLGWSAGAGATVVVEEVAPGGMGHAVGVDEGRRFDAWQLLDAEGGVVDEGRLAHPFDFVALQYDVAPRGPMRLRGEAGAVDLPWEEWGIAVRPPLPHGVEQGDDRARWTREAAEAATDPMQRAWWLAESADAVAADAEDASIAADAVDALYEAALAEASASAAARSQLLRRWGDRAKDRSDFDAARAHYETALALDEERAPGGLPVARSHMRLAALEGRLRAIAAAREHCERAIEVLRSHARPGPLLAESLGTYSFVLNLLGAMDEGQAANDEALAIVEETGLEGRVALLVLNNRGNLFSRRGDYATAVQMFDRIIEIAEGQGSEGRIVGNAWFNRSVCVRRLGDLEDAERSLLRSLEIRRAQAEESLDVAQCYVLLGTLASERRDHAASQDWYERAVALYEELAPDSYSLALALVNLGAACAHFERFEETEEHYTRAEGILARVAPNSYMHVQSLRNLASLYRNQERWDEAEAMTIEVLASIRSMAPGSLDEADLLDLLAHDAYRREDHDLALERFGGAWEIRSRIAPGSRFTAASAYWMGEVHADRDDLDQAVDCYCDAVDAMDAQRVRFGGTEAQHVDFAEDYRLYAARCLESLVVLGEPERAFGILERTRARFLLSLFADRDGLLDGATPPAIMARRAAHAEAVDATLAELARLGAAATARGDTLRARLASLEIERQEIAADLRLQAPRLGALESARTLDAAQALEVLDPGTAFVSYWLGPDVTTAFVVPAADDGRTVETVVLPIGLAALEETVGRFRDGITNGASVEALDEIASSLHASLIAPLSDRLEGADRLLVSPDGPLRVLPFAALRDAGGSHLLERFPIHVVDSVTLYARLVEGRRDFDAVEARVVAFGDPVYEAADDDVPVAAPVLALRERGFDLQALPGTRAEVAVLDSLFARPVRSFLGAQATEANVMALGTDVDILHFACHAVADREIPSASALVLTVPSDPEQAPDNGLLQAWEILEGLRVDAELVTLSACETAIGKQLGSEGMAGLTRAFQFAGARSIVASLWNVPDAPTARLMRDFYAKLVDGLPKDEALRRAQLALLRSGRAGDDGAARALGGLAPSDQPAVSHPSYTWAAMQLIGDWR